MVNEEQSEEQKQKAQDYLEIYNLLIRGMDVIGAFMHSTETARKSSAGKQLERAYILLRRDYLAMLDEHPELEIKEHSVLNTIQRLGGSYTAEYLQEWAEGSIEPDGSGGFLPYRYGGNHSYEDELATISEKAYLAGLEDIEEKPKNIRYKKSYDEAYEAIKSVKAADIKEYRLTWDEYSGEVLVNDVWKIGRTYVNSESDKTLFMEKIKEHQDAGENKFEFDISPKNKTRHTSQTINELGISPLLRKIFLKDSKANHICFRSPVQRITLLRERIDENELHNEVDLNIVESELRKDKK